MNSAKMGLAVIGCGYAADFYAANLPNHPDLDIVGVYDRVDGRARRFAATYKLFVFDSLRDLLMHPKVDVVLNLTNPASHADVTRAALNAGKHVYSEKPLALSFAEGEQLVALAASRGLSIGAAPCNVLGDAFQTVLQIERSGLIGESLVAECRLHEGAIHLMRHDRWISKSGSPWPSADEFETGCVLEHGAYILDLLVALWGEIDTISAKVARIFPNKGSGVRAPDWAAAVITFKNGRCARISCSIVEPRDHQLNIIGGSGVIILDDIWRFESPVHIRRGQQATEERPHDYLGAAERVPLLNGPRRTYRYVDTHDIDYLRGVSALAHSIRRGRRQDGRYALHVLEATLAIAAGGETRYRMRTTPPPFAVPDWAEAAAVKASLGKIT